MGRQRAARASCRAAVLFVRCTRRCVAGFVCVLSLWGECVLCGGLPALAGGREKERACVVRRVYIYRVNPKCGYGDVFGDPLNVG